LNKYFGQIRDANPARWEQGRSGAILSNPGVRAYLLLLAEMFRYCATKRGTDPDVCDDAELLSMVSETIPPLLEFVKTASDSEVQERFSRRFGEGGVVEYHYRLCRILHDARGDFGSEDFRKWLLTQDQVRIDDANKRVIAIDRDLRDYVFRVLKSVHGENAVPGSGGKAYWERGVDNSKIKTDAYGRQQQDRPDKRHPVEAYVNTIELKSIVRQSQ